MAKRELLEKYARLAVCSGVNVQKGQLLVIRASVTDYAFVRMCVKEAFAQGASDVQITWSDEEIDRMHYVSCDKETLVDIPDWVYDRRKDQQDKGACFLSIISETPGLLKEVDPEKLRASSMAASKKMAPLRMYTMANEGQWSIVALPSVGWAKQLFPELSDDEAVERLMDAILLSVRVREDNDPVQEWVQHSKEIHMHCEKMNAYRFKSLHFKNGLGTDLLVELPEHHIWAGGSEFTTKGIEFNPNMPTEEMFSMPHRTKVNGVVYASMPLDHNGVLIEDFWLKFEQGRIVDFGAAKGYEALKSIIETDEGSHYLGEVALISYDSPIKNTGILFLNTLFDENASCHLAIGAAYPMNIQGGNDMNEEERLAHGVNVSMTHVDFMFGSADMHITGTQYDGTVVTVFDEGNFVF